MLVKGAGEMIGREAKLPGEPDDGEIGIRQLGMDPLAALLKQRNASLTAAFSAIGGPSTGLRGEYYNEASNAAYPLTNPFAGSPVLTRMDPTVDFNGAVVRQVLL